MTAPEKYQEARSRVAEAMKAARNVAKEAFADCSKEFFAAFPEVEAMYWTQYTPYFSDGDECTFSVNEVELRAVGDEGEEYDGEGRTRWGNKYYAGKPDEYPDYKPVPDKAFDLAEALMGTFSQDDLRGMFGDHVQITVTRSGVDVDTYDHDHD